MSEYKTLQYSDYVVIEGGILSDVEGQIRSHLLKGYHPVGGIIPVMVENHYSEGTHLHFYQAVALPTTNKK